VAKVAPSDAGRRHAEDIRREQVATAIAGLKDIFFGFDSWNVSEEAKHALEGDAQWLQSNPEKIITIEGHCDERGTQAYNIVLGEKRAKAVRNYLVELGVGTGRLTVTSYGKERPFCKDHDETCYQQNRRGHMTLRVR
jgi:peptidoglycan-associated lipoprotein